MLTLRICHQSVRWMLISLGLILPVSNLAAQQAPEYQLRVESNLALVDVTAVDHNTYLPDKTLTAADLTVLDEGKPVHLTSFDMSDGPSVRPLALWIVLQCPQKQPAGGSEFLNGKAGMLRDGLSHLHTRDTVAVADWCDDGSYAVDQEPTSATGRAIDAADRVLAKPIFVNNTGSTRAGELALQAMLRSIADSASQTHPRPLPVLLFLHRDVTGAPNEEVIRLLKLLLENSSIGYVLNDGKGSYQFSSRYLMTNTGFVLRALSERTGGALLAVTNYPQDPLAYSEVLANILDRLHGRYQLGFVPQVRDGKVHRLQVKLSDEGRQRHPGLLLGSRLSYLAPSSGPAQ